MRGEEKESQGIVEWGYSAPRAALSCLLTSIVPAPSSGGEWPGALPQMGPCLGRDGYRGQWPVVCRPRV